MAPGVLLPSTLVDVCGDVDDGFAGSWREAVVFELKGKDELVVQYLQFTDGATGHPLRGTVLRTRLRPSPPIEVANFASMEDVKLGHTVEAYRDDCWWMGSVVNIATAGVQVNLHESDCKTVFVRDYRLLRPRMELAKGYWRRVVPSRAQLRKLGLATKAADTAMREMEAIVAVRAGTPRLRSLGSAAGASQKPLVPSRPGGADAAGGGAATAAAAGPSGMSTRAARAKSTLEPAKAIVKKGKEPTQGRGGRSCAAAAKPQVGKGHKGGVVRQQLTEAGVAAEDNDEDAVFESDDDEEDHDGDENAAAEVVTDAIVVDDDVEDVEDDEDAERESSDEEDEDAKGQQGGAAAGPSSIAAAAGMAVGVLRPRRENKARLVYVNGIPVLKDNMYGLHDEDTMVWQRGLQDGQSSMEGVKLRPPSKPARVRPSNAGKPAAAPRQHPPEYQARLDHNNAIRRDTQAAEGHRARYLLRQWDEIKPFITAKVEAHIRKVAGNCLPAAPLPPPVTEQPGEILAHLREYQLEGLAWLMAQYDRGLNAILGDEMGLGKTLQTITFLAHLKFVRGVEGPHLVVVPLSVLSSWMSEFKKWCPSLRVVRLHSCDVSERRRLVKEVLAKPATFDVAVTTYDMVNSQHFGHSLKHTLVWRYLVLDEGHKVKNEESQVSDGMRHISRQAVLMLTGTPIQNNLHELFALLSFMYPDVFTDATTFDAAFNITARVADAAKLEAVHQLLRPFMLRRLKEEVEVDLPPKLETRIQCPLAPMQTFWYRRLLLKDSSILQQMEAADKEAPQQSAESGARWKKAMNLLMQLRKVCNHPFMFPDAEPDFDGESTPEELVSGSGKMLVLDRMLARLKDRGHRVVLFSQFNIMLDIIEDYLGDRGYNYRRLDGSTNRIKRMIDIEQFNRPKSDIFIYILCTRAGGLGVNLQTADTCILFDSDWNPQWDLQAMARVHRIGQTRPVHVYRLVSEGTVEERIQRRAESKLYLDQMINRGSTSNAEQMEGLHANEVLAMLKYGADRIFRNEAGSMPSDQQLDTVMDRSRMMEDAAAARLRPHTAPAGTGTGTGQAGPACGGAPKVGARGSGEDASSTDSDSEDPTAAERAGSGASAGTSGGAAAAGGALQDNKQTALDFDAEAPPVDTLTFQGQDYRAIRAQGTTLRDIASQYWEDKKRERRERLVDIDGFKVLRDNVYTMEEGMLHCPGQQRGQGASGSGRRKTQRAGVDYDHSDFCLVCWDGGDLLCCDHCPASFHAECMGFSKADILRLSKRSWSCPHHSCTKCERTTATAGGLLFRCEMCEKAFCEDDLPSDYHMVGECDFFKALGQRPRGQACFIHCSDRCRELSTKLRPLLDRAMAAAVAQGPPGQQGRGAQVAAAAPPAKKAKTARR